MRPLYEIALDAYAAADAREALDAAHRPPPNQNKGTAT